jgi:hypothetical protein
MIRMGKWREGGSGYIRQKLRKSSLTTLRYGSAGDAKSLSSNASGRAAFGYELRSQLGNNIRIRTFYEEDMSSRILPLAIKVPNDSSNILRRRHEDVDRLETWLLIPVRRDALYHCPPLQLRPFHNHQIRGHTSDIFLENIKLLQHSAQELVRVVVDDQDLPAPLRLHAPDCFQELCESVTQSALYAITMRTSTSALVRTVPISDIAPARSSEFGLGVCRTMSTRRSRMYTERGSETIEDAQTRVMGIGHSFLWLHAFSGLYLGS